MSFNINSSINMKSINKVSSIVNNVAFKDKFYDDVEKGTYAEIDYSNEAGIDIQEGIEAADKAREDRIKREQEEARLKLEQERQAKIDKLNDLYKQRDDNNGLFHPIKEAEIEAEILKMEKELGVEHKPDGFEKACDVVKSTGATIVVGTTSVVSGIVDLGESAVDGCIWLGGTVVSGGARLVGADDFANKVEQGTMDAIAYDATAEINKAFYEGTALGRAIDDASYMKYDSETAKMIQSGTKAVTIAVAATAATVVTGGAAAPLIATVAIGAGGFVVAAGDSAEQKFQDKDNRDFWGSAGEIALDGGIGALSTIATGKAGATLYTGVKSLSGVGLNSLKEAGKETIKSFNKDALKNTIKYSGKKIAKQAAVDSLKESSLETAAVLLDDVKTGIKTGEWDVKNMILEAGGIYAANYVGNFAGGYASGVVDYSKKIDRISDMYIDAQSVAETKYNKTFRTYREHADGHVYYVTKYAEDLSKGVDGINGDEVVFAALSHDLGMKGGYIRLDDGTYALADSLNIPKIGDKVRKNHPLNSALSVLTEDVVPDGMDRDVISLLAMSHSKSTSGITHFDNPDEWKKCIDSLDGALKQYNIDNGTKFSLDTDKLYGMIDDPDTFTRLQKEAVIVRDGDAMSKVKTIDGNTLMQDGKTISKVENHTPRTSFNDPVASEDVELSGLSDTLYDLDGNELLDSDASGGVKFHAGELNANFDSSTDGTSFYKASVNLNEPNQIPHSTVFAVKERIGEVNTYTNISDRSLKIELPKEAEGSALHEFYEAELGKITDELRASARSQLDDGIISREVYDKQINFYNNIKVECTL